ncbi:DNA-binding protein [Candidatus Symbiopectobacterium endolongispinus]|uniref:DNA-binding protein n=1 Tax=Candidatus Symbiopectobacterium endolongispinus TaxID=2812664 RepID=UPI002079902F|nr:DNA-binding protein [Candidatus Symbiopectobacterium endolongispinus]
MGGINLKSHYTAQEIAFMRLPGLPGTRTGVSVRAKNEGWSSRPRSGQGGGYEYALDSMPSDIQNKIREYYYNTLLQQQPVKAPAAAKTTASSSQLLEIVRQCPAVLDQKTAQLTQKQRDIADARMVLVVEVLRLEDTGLSRIKAIDFICDRSRSSDLPEHLQKYVDLANARKGQRVGVSVRALNQWVVDYLRAKNNSERLALLAPGHKKAKQPELVAWVPMFMAPGSVTVTA